MNTFSHRIYYYKIQPGDTLQSLAQRYYTSVNSILAANPWLNPYNFCVGQMISIYPGNYISNNRPTNCIPNSVFELSKLMRLLWMQHIEWTREAIISLVEDYPAKELVVERLLRNPKDIGKALESFYSDQVVSTFVDLLTDHLTIAADLVNAVKTGDTDTATDANKKWYENADQIATFLSSINPYWTKKEVLEMFNRHLDLTKEEVLYRINKDYESDIKDHYDIMQIQILEMADMFTNGIVKQFPNKFLN